MGKLKSKNKSWEIKRQWNYKDGKNYQDESKERNDKYESDNDDDDEEEEVNYRKSNSRIHPMKYEKVNKYVNGGENVKHRIQPIKYDKGKSVREEFNQRVQQIKYEKGKYLSPVFSDDSDDSSSSEDLNLSLEETPKER